MTVDELKYKALNLPLLPGVYIIRDGTGNVIYVGKAKKLKNRVSQYFQDSSAHSPKTKLMVSKADDFDVIITDTEFDALVLECSLIKKHMPKYNILLKDDKGYPYLRIDMKQEYPEISLANKITDDAEYFGPYGSRGITQNVKDTVVSTFMLPSCNRKFPRDIGKGRPCLNFHMNQCLGWCQQSRSEYEYRQVIEEAKQLLRGNYKDVASSIRKQMLEAADNMNFELAASLRDKLSSVESLGRKQLVSMRSNTMKDVVGYAQIDEKACFAVLHYTCDGLREKEYEVFTAIDDSKSVLSSLILQYYQDRDTIPSSIFVPFALDDMECIEQFLCSKNGRKVRLHVPQRGNNAQLMELANKNAEEEVLRVITQEERASSTLKQLSSILSIDIPRRIEAFDISNISGTDIVASMVVIQGGRPLKREYKRFKINGLEQQDDYSSMRQVISRRFSNYSDQTEGFTARPDLLLIDGGRNHAKIALEALREYDISIPVVGMVKDDRHRTRALITPEGYEIGIDTNQAVYSFIGMIQEEAHRFAINYHRKLRSKRLKYSELDLIPGVGAKRKELLLKNFHSLNAIKQATLPELERLLPKDVAIAVHDYFLQKKTDGKQNLCE